MKHLILAAALGFAVAPLPALAAESTTTTQSSPTQSQLVSSYSGWAGSRQNSQALVGALRNGGTATLTDSSGQSSTVSASKGTGWGNVSLALSAASFSLSQYGITNPSPSQISAALNGGTIMTSSGQVSLQGVQSMRDSGMGWGQIAAALGTTVGQLQGKGHQKSAAAPGKSDKGDDANANGKAKAEAKSNNAQGHASGEGGSKGNASGGHGNGAGGGNGGGNGGGGGKGGGH
ncbi:hypothetical protein [Chitinilyticum piscinae]|uniref:Uncharacterized protein n=1 Tax=Chitinilyticum piscinae TaxID=2866724 RepID=A0A8J7K120_9NEIS|nr:hypothetical protein [Chitinilyticum piscinae]MBE9607987.1 hypothetical protein [Chitinilyticum piscinae]